MIPALLAALLSTAAPEPLSRRVQDPVRWWQGDTFADLRSSSDSLRGLTARLDPIARGGFRGVVLPLLCSRPELERAACADWDRIDPRFGTLEDFSALVTAAHQRQLAVLVEVQVNHVSRTHPWFVAAEAGDRFAEERFVFSEKFPEGWEPAVSGGEPWSKSETLGRWFHHAHHPAAPDLNLRDRPTRAKVIRVAEQWLERGADGLVVQGIRHAFEDGPGKQVDRPESHVLAGEISAMSRRHGALLMFEAGGPAEAAELYLEGSSLAIDVDSSRELSRAVAASSVEAAVARAENLSSNLSAFALALSDAGASPLARAAAVTAGGVAFLAPEPLDPTLEKLLELKQRSAALSSGLRVPVVVRGAPGLWAFLRQDGNERVLVLLHFGEERTRATLDLGSVPSGAWPALLGDGAPLVVKRGKASVVVEPRSVQLHRAPAEEGAFTVRFAAPGAPAASAGEAIDRAAVLDPRRKLGFSRDASDVLRCTRDRRGKIDRCGVTLQRTSRFSEDDLRWHALLEPGPYQVEVTLADPRLGASGPVLEAEGERLAPRGKVLARSVFVRDGKLTLAAVPLDRGGATVEILAIEISPAPFRAVDVPVKISRDRLVLEAPGPGVVEWRMNDASTEPVEQAPIVKRDGRWQAVLGPWPAGEVSAVAWVIRGEKGGFVTADRGAEFVSLIR